MYYVTVLKYLVMCKSEWWGSKLTVSVASTVFWYLIKGFSKT